MNAATTRTGLLHNSIGVNTVPVRESRHVRTLHRRWAPNQPVPAAIGDAGTRLLVATRNHRPAGYVVVSPPRGLEAAARRAGWSNAALQSLDGAAVVDALVIDPRSGEYSAMVGDALAAALDTAVTAAGRPGLLRVCGETQSDLAEFWVGHGFRITDTLVWTYPHARALNHSAKAGRLWFHRDAATS